MAGDHLRVLHTSHAALVARVEQAFDLVITWYERSHQRRQLLALSDSVLRDIGRSRADAEAEAAKPFWRP